MRIAARVSPARPGSCRRNEIRLESKTHWCASSRVDAHVLPQLELERAFFRKDSGEDACEKSESTTPEKRRLPF